MCLREATDILQNRIYVIWRDVAHLVLKSLNFYGNLSAVQRRVITVCLPKLNNQKQCLKNWWPITSIKYCLENCLRMHCTQNKICLTSTYACRPNRFYIGLKYCRKYSINLWHHELHTSQKYPCNSTDFEKNVMEQVFWNISFFLKFSHCLDKNILQRYCIFNN